MGTVDSSQVKRSQAAELSDLQAEYNEKKKKVIKQQEREMQTLKENFDGRKEALNTQNDAVINHIRKSQAQQQEMITEKRAELFDKQKEQITDLQDNYEKDLYKTREGFQQNVGEARKTSREKLNTIQQDTEKKISDTRMLSKQRIESVKEKTEAQIQKESEKNNEHLSKVKENNSKQLANEIEKGRVVQDELHETQQKQFNDTKERGEKKITEVKVSKENELKRNELTYEKKEKKEKEEWNQRYNTMFTTETNRINHDKEAFEDQLKLQQKHHQQNYQNNDLRNKQALRIQNDIYSREINDAKKKFFRSSEKYADKADDPFYRIEDRGSYMKESSDFYVVKAFVPQHEKNDIKVVVQPDKVTISGQRSFVDDVKDEEGKRVSSNSYQSFREEFAFDKPIVKEGMTRERDGDWVTYHIPKLNSMGFNKKA